jgi:predicted Fe-Mo cluster-binding NifX family protein
MIEAIADCEALIVRGMGRGAYSAVEQAHIRPVVTDLASPEQAAMAYAAGTLANLTDRLH